MGAARADGASVRALFAAAGELRDSGGDVSWAVAGNDIFGLVRSSPRL
ncbi:hypothetical protein [Streptomyces corynorhini]|nr:hypothetical protein [Streptomyces corynorhini]